MVPAAPDPVKLIAALLWRDDDALAEALALLRECFGDTDHMGAVHPFDHTPYYEREMGTGLKKRIVSFGPLIAPEDLVEKKLAALRVEDACRGSDRGRRVNVDPGYLDIHKVVLASVKSGGPKIYLGRGVYADLVTRYSSGKFVPWDWTFTDYKAGRYDADFLKVRRLYKACLARGGA